MERFKEKTPAVARFSIRDRLLIGRRMFRLLTVDVLGLVEDARTPVRVSEAGTFETDIIHRVEIRTGAIDASLNRFKIEKEIGSEGYRSGVENSLLEELAID